MTRTRLLLGIAIGAMAVAWWLWPHNAADLASSQELANPAGAPVRTVFPLPNVQPDAPRDPEPGEIRDNSALLHDVDPSQLAWLEGSVFEADGRPATQASVFVRSADGQSGATAIDAAGHFRVAVPPGGGTVHAVRWDGLVQVSSTTESFDLQTGEVLGIGLELPAHYGGEPGLVATEHDEGLQVAWIVPGSNADRLGLAEGDVILEIDGRPATDLDEAAFDAAMVGAEGTEIALRIRFADEHGAFESAVSVERSAIDDIDEKAKDSG